MTAGQVIQERDASTSGVNTKPSRVPKCELHQNSGRNLVVCIDGTSNQFGKKNTSVVELYHLLPKSKTQITYYNSGIGTFARPSWKSLRYWIQVAENIVDLAIAWHFEKTIIDAYRWLSEMYEEGDRIFLFGFSRGAYQVRVLSAMIDKVGLIHKGNEGQIPFAFEIYAHPVSPLKTKEWEEYEKNTARFKSAFCRDVDIHFVGVWDTVSSVGAVKARTLPGTTYGMQHVCHFRHALALDERRVKFLPEFVYGGSASPPPQDKPQTPETVEEEWQDRSTSSKGTSKKQVDSKEVWFAGTHSDVGGGNVDNEEMNRSGPPLMWMLSEAVACGLRVSTDTSQGWNWENTHPPHESLKFVWWLFEFIPFKRLDYKSVEGITHMPHLGRGRGVQEGQRIHASVVTAKFVQVEKLGFFDWLSALLSRDRNRPQRLKNSEYIPKATLPSQNQDWLALFHDEQRSAAVVEQDLYQKVRLFSVRLDAWDDLPFLGEEILQQLDKELAALTQTDVDCWALGVVPSVSKSLLKIMSRIEDQAILASVLVNFNSIQGGNGGPADLPIFIPFDERLIPLWHQVGQGAKQALENDEPAVRVVEDPARAALELSLTPAGTVIFHDSTSQHLGLMSMPFELPTDATRLYRVLRSAGTFWFHLKRSSTRGFARDVGLECYKLAGTDEYDDWLLEILAPDGKNLNENGLITVYPDDEASYGFKLVNSSSNNYYVSMFYYDLSDLSISCHYTPPPPKPGQAQYPLPAQGTLTIGYGPGSVPPIQYVLRQGQRLDVGIVKIYVSLEPVDLASIAQASPFGDAAWKPKAAGVSKEEPVWDEFTVTILQRKRT